MPYTETHSFRWITVRPFFKRYYIILWTESLLARSNGTVTRPRAFVVGGAVIAFKTHSPSGAINTEGYSWYYFFQKRKVVPPSFWHLPHCRARHNRHVYLYMNICKLIVYPQCPHNSVPQGPTTKQKRQNIRPHEPKRPRRFRHVGMCTCPLTVLHVRQQHNASWNRLSCVQTYVTFLLTYVNKKKASRQVEVCIAPLEKVVKHRQINRCMMLKGYRVRGARRWQPPSPPREHPPRLLQRQSYLNPALPRQFPVSKHLHQEQAKKV